MFSLKYGLPAALLLMYQQHHSLRRRPLLRLRERLLRGHLRCLPMLQRHRRPTRPRLTRRQFQHRNQPQPPRTTQRMCRRRFRQ